MFVRARLITLVVAILSVPVSLLAADDPLLGTWKMNIAKSTFDPDPTPQSVIRKHEPSGNGIKVTSNTVGKGGKKQHFEFTATFDGKYYPVTAVGTVDRRDEIALKRIDAYTVETMNRNRGKQSTHSRWVVSKDGKTLTNSVDGVTPEGQTVHHVHFYEKQ